MMFIKLHKLSYDKKKIDDLFVDPFEVSAFFPDENDPKYTFIHVGGGGAIFKVAETPEQILALSEMAYIAVSDVEGEGDGDVEVVA
jgi:hypothetical protein